MRRLNFSLRSKASLFWAMSFTLFFILCGPMFIKWSDDSNAAEKGESEDVQRVKAESNAFYQSAKEKSDRGAYQEASEDIEKALEIYPENIPAILHSANLKAYSGDRLGAIQAWERAQEIYRKIGQPENAELLETRKSIAYQAILDGEGTPLEDE
ncbi:MAG: hypothetical protein HC879_04070 [Leptolyngbyaceae cyanobacterium SL_5_9]|nr:hypothetical protein [Leptolyngbyaceae cyanobacterium SM1_4_3]NJN56715.1 hypothetical protein [Leptolyngbyaceae cyanobacterium SL_5_9]